LLWILCVFMLLYPALRFASSAISRGLYICVARCSYRSQLAFKLCNASSARTQPIKPIPCTSLHHIPRSYNYSIPNGPGTIDSMRHDPKKHDSSPARGTIYSA
jgi:hypothetical protein